MIGALVYKLRAENSAQLPFINGRIMHAVLFKILNDFSPQFGSFVHNELNIKPFTVSFLEPVDRIPQINGRWQVRQGDRFLWRLTGLNEQILQAELTLPIGKKIQAGSLRLSLEEIICDRKIRDDSGVIAVKDFISSVKNVPAVKGIDLNFVSPTSFRIDDFDAPYPRAELIFTSLADKWTQAEMPAAVEKNVIRDFASKIRLTSWSGESKKFYLAQNRGVQAFWGNFSYNVEGLSEEVRRVFLLFAKFGEFAGVGRLTGQGFGQVRASCIN